MEVLINLISPNWIERELVSLSNNENILEGIQNIVYTHTYQSATDLELVKNDLTYIRQKTIEQHIRKKTIDLKEAENLIDSFVSQELYDEIIPICREKFCEKDLNFYKFSMYCCKKDVSPKQLGSTFYNFIPKAALVELSLNLTNQRTPLEKINCLCTTYDLIFVEVKSALISAISKYADEENYVPVINNHEILPVVMAVILRSKLFYFSSDLFYIRHFGGGFLEANPELDNILEVFEKALTIIFELETSSEWMNKNNFEKLSPNLDVSETIRFVDDNEIRKNKCVKNAELKIVDNNQSILDEEYGRIALQITSATTENLT